MPVQFSFSSGPSGPAEVTVKITGLRGVTLNAKRDKYWLASFEGKAGFKARCPEARPVYAVVKLFCKVPPTERAKIRTVKL